MKKLCMLITCVGTLTFSTVQVEAQFNRRFDAKSVVWSLVKCDKGDFCTVSATGFRRYDFNGNLLWQRYYSNLPYFTVTGNTTPTACRLVHTDDDGVIYFSTNKKSLNPVAVKLDVNGDVVWAREYPSTPSLVEMLTDFIRVDAERMPMEEENYIFTTTGTPYNEVSSPEKRPNTIDVLRIDKNGDLIWNHKFFEPPTGSYYVRDLTNTISYGGESADGKPLYYLAGVRVEYSNLSGETYSMYQMMIDFDGEIAVPYQFSKICSYPNNIDALYDKEVKSVITTVTMNKCELAGPPTGSQVGIIRSNEKLQIGAYNYYWMPKSNDNRASRIEKTEKTKTPGYVLSGWTYDQAIFEPYGDNTGARNMTLLKVDINGTPLMYKHYMVAEDAGLTPDLIVNQDPNTGEDVYVMSALTRGHGAFTDYGRIVGTDPNADVCGVYKFDIKRDKTEIAPKKKEYTYVKYDKQARLEMREVRTIIEFEDCKFNSQYGYKPTGINDIQNRNNLLKVYPTYLTSGQHLINMTAAEANHSGIVITVTAIDGRKVIEQHLDQVGADEVFTVDVSALNTGSYILSVKSKDGRLNTATKVSRM